MHVAAEFASMIAPAAVREAATMSAASAVMKVTKSERGRRRIVKRIMVIWSVVEVLSILI